MDPKFAGKAIAAPYSGRTDIDQMPDTPNRGAHHRRAQSETFFRFPDDILLDDVVADFNLASLDIPSLSSDTEANAPMALDSSKSDSSNGGDKSKPTRSTGPTPHFRSLSVGADFFEGLEFTSGDGGAAAAAESERFGGKPPAASHYRHRHSNSMDGSMSSFEADSSVMIDGVKKTMAPDRLAELALLDPKRAKRILANRQSAARSKERKIRYTNELERKVQTLQTEATTLSAQVTMLQRDTTGLTTENKELKLRLQAMEQQAHLRDALNEALREEVQRLKIATGQIPAANGNPFNRALPPQFSSHPQMFQQFGTNQTQQPRQQHQTPNAQPQQSFSDFNQRVP
ncbi:Transcription factor VIP1 [Camellia lanceoleosa]|uniref:Transcription factor VIP1 n=1 Tax=Camellia lanceoleosa TaxID=1840588 RepID=A0ACC0G9J3_9ERIC|nr:Transcription factor VIP1 [Camellia lanceoleosa]